MENLKQSMRTDAFDLFTAHLQTFKSQINSAYSLLFAVLKKANAK